MRLGLLVLLMLASSACGLATHVRPTPAGQIEFEGAVGGPAAEVNGVPVLLPLTTVGASYGIVDRLDVSAHLHLSSLVLLNPGLDLGVSGLLMEENRGWPAITVGVRGYGFTDFTAFKPYFEVNLTGSYKLFDYVLVYASAAGVGAYDGNGHASAALGAQLRLERWSFQLEVRWYDLTYDTRYSSVRWLSPDGMGALGGVFGASYRFDLLR
jgi:hypothetical protein